MILDYFLYFLIGGSIVSLTVFLAKQGYPLLSGIALIFPSYTLLSFLLIGRNVGNAAVIESAKSALLCTFIAWVPYVLIIIYLTQKWGLNNALIIGVSIFLVITLIWIYLKGNIFI